MELQLEPNIAISDSDFLRVYAEVKKQFGNVLVERNLTANSSARQRGAKRSQGASQLRIRKRLARSISMKRSQTRQLTKEKLSYDQIHQITLNMGFGVSEGIALAALVYSAWSYSHSSQHDRGADDRCKRICRRGRRCQRKFVYQEKQVVNNEIFIVLWCIRKHETRLRIE